MAPKYTGRQTGRRADEQLARQTDRQTVAGAERRRSKQATEREKTSEFLQMASKRKAQKLEAKWNQNLTQGFWEHARVSSRVGQRGEGRRRANDREI